MRSAERFVQRLCAISTARHTTPWEHFAWPDTVDREEVWCSSPALSTIAGTPLADELDERTAKRLAFFEAKAFFSMNVHGERVLLEGASQRLFQPGCEPWSEYLAHLIEEEVHHSAVFARFCEQYAGGLYLDRKVAFAREYAAGEEDLLFFARILVFEQIVDAINSRTAEDEAVAPLVRAIHAYHHEDETRHLAFGRHVVQELWRARRDEWPSAVIDRVRADLTAFLASTWRELAPSSVYRDVGLENPAAVARLALEHPACRARQAELSARAVDFLTDLELMEKEPTP